MTEQGATFAELDLSVWHLRASMPPVMDWCVLMSPDMYADWENAARLVVARTAYRLKMRQMLVNRFGLTAGDRIYRRWVARLGWYD